MILYTIVSIVGCTFANKFMRDNLRKDTVRTKFSMRCHWLRGNTKFSTNLVYTAVEIIAHQGARTIYVFWPDVGVGGWLAGQ